VSRLVFLGPPGAGKGTQARALATALHVPQIATGDMLREAAAAGTTLGLEARRYMEAGRLVPDPVVIGLIAERLAAADARSGFILDGFPRTLAQAESLDRLLKDQGQGIDRVIFFEVGETELLRRLTGRRACPACGATFHLAFAPPKAAGRCDRCGSALVQRDDDREATVRARLAVYAEQTVPLLDYYRARDLLTTVAGEGDVAAVGRAVRRAAGLPA
jgi:adenylate kinase